MSELTSGPEDAKFTGPDLAKLQEQTGIFDPERPRPPLRQHIESKRLYHGSVAGDIAELNPADETTLGLGVYLTSMSEPAAQYAEKRAKNGGRATLYEADIKDVTLANLTDTENLQEILQGFVPVLEAAKQQEGQPWYTHAAIQKSLDNIRDGKIVAGNLKAAVYGVQGLFTDYMASQGYDGLIGVEYEPAVDPHDSYVMFNPSKVTLVGEHPLAP